MAETHLAALHSSVERLRNLADSISDAELTQRAYPSEWSIADVFSHLGSGAFIHRRRLDDVIAGQPTPDDFAPGVWDTWNAKPPAARRQDALVTDAELITRLDAVTADQRDRFSFAMGPMTFGFDEFVGLRLNEHALHTWDIEVARNSAATIPDNIAALVIDNLEMIARFTGKPTGDTRSITIATTDPERRFRVDLGQDSITFGPAQNGRADVELAAEAFIRLVYGRLEPEHTPPGEHSPDLETLRRAFPGV
jgi:uncharacterized protein (TIGR03083 family)